MFRLHSRSGSRRRLGLGVATVAVLVAVAAPAPAQATPFVYVTGGYRSHDVSQFDAGAGGLLAPLSPPTVAADQRPTGVAVSPDGRSVYVANAGRFELADPGGLDAGDNVSQFTIGVDGGLSPKSPPSVAAGDYPFDVAVSPDGKSVYVASMLSSRVFQYDVGQGGKLSPKSPATVFADSAVAVAVSPDGKSVYVVSGDPEGNGGIDAVLQYDVGPGGKLSPKSPPTVDAGDFSIDLAVSPNGKSVYVVNVGFFYSIPSRSTASVSQYDVGPGGKLSPKSPATVAAGIHPVAVAVSPDGRSVYVINAGSGSGGSDNVHQFDVGPSGALVPKSPPRVATGKYPDGVTVSPDGENVFVANGGNWPQRGNISQYDVGAAGELSPKSPATVAAGLSPARIAVSPVPTTKGQCKNGGWKQFGFKDQGRCIRFVKRG
jgi:DNA-binding beta-propeller fold protein YncE